VDDDLRKLVFWPLDLFWRLSNEIIAFAAAGLLDVASSFRQGALFLQSPLPAFVLSMNVPRFEAEHCGNAEKANRKQTCHKLLLGFSEKGSACELS